MTLSGPSWNKSELRQLCTHNEGGSSLRKIEARSLLWMVDGYLSQNDLASCRILAARTVLGIPRSELTGYDNSPPDGTAADASFTHLGGFTNTLVCTSRTEWEIPFPCVCKKMSHGGLNQAPTPSQAIEAWAGYAAAQLTWGPPRPSSRLRLSFQLGREFGEQNAQKSRPRTTKTRVL